jgi:hypothetical protein
MGAFPAGDVASGNGRGWRLVPGQH